MARHQVLLICLHPLLSEGLHRILDQQEDVELVSLESTDSESLQACTEKTHPDIILIAGEREDDAATHLISNLLNCWTDTPVVWIELETNVIRRYTSHTLPATSRELIETIRQVSTVSAGDLRLSPHSSRR